MYWIMIIRHDSNINVFPNACMADTPSPFVQAQKAELSENEMGKELSEKSCDDVTTSPRPIAKMNATAAEQADAQKAAEEIVFGFYRSGFAKCNSFA